MTYNRLIREDVFNHYAEFAQIAFSYFNGRVNRYLPAKLFIKYTDYVNKNFGCLDYPSRVTIYVSECIDPYYINGQYITKQMDNLIKTQICMVIIHELFHLEQWIGPAQTIDNGFSKEFSRSFEEAVVYRTAGYMSLFKTDIEAFLGFEVMDNPFLPAPKYGTEYGEYEPTSMKEYYYSIIARLIICPDGISGLDLLQKLSHLFDNNKIKTLVIVFNGTEEIPIKYNYHFTSMPAYVKKFNTVIELMTYAKGHRDMNILIDSEGENGVIKLDLLNWVIVPIEIKNN